MHNIGSIDSIATVIFLAGQERFATHGSSFLFHGIAANFQKDTALTLSQIRERESSVKEDENKIARIITERTSLTDQEIHQLFGQGESKNPEFAKLKGIITNIVEATIPDGAPIITINVN